MRSPWRALGLMLLLGFVALAASGERDLAMLVAGVASLAAFARYLITRRCARCGANVLGAKPRFFWRNHHLFPPRCPACGEPFDRTAAVQDSTRGELGPRGP